MLRKIIFGIIWYIIIVNALAFLFTFPIGFYYGMIKNPDGFNIAMKIYGQYQWAIIIMALILTVIGTAKGLLPWTKSKPKDGLS